MLELGRVRVAGEGLGNIEFRQGDATCTGLPSGCFDAVVCVFGVFFAPDMAAFAAEMWRLVRPGGVLAVTTWGPGLFEPANSLFWDSIRAAEPALFKAFNPAQLTSPAIGRQGTAVALPEDTVDLQQFLSGSRGMR